MRIATNCICCGSSKLLSSSAVLMPFVAHRVFDWKPILITKRLKFKHLKLGMAYPLCNSLICFDCNLLFLDIRFDDLEMKRLYDNYRGKSYVILRNKYEPGYKIINKVQNSQINYKKKIENFLYPLLKFPLDILDYGGDNGKNTVFKDKKNLIHIFDISNKPTITESRNFKKKYDLIVLSQVIEHVSYPGIIIKSIKKMMKKNSILYIEVPIEKAVQKIWGGGAAGGRAKKSDILTCLKNKKHWHEHINFYSKRALIKLINNCDLKIVKMNSLSVQQYKNWQFIQIACKKF